MKQLELTLPSDTDIDLIEQIIQEVITERGLNITLRDTLKSYPGSTHWHLKKGVKRAFWKLPCGLSAAALGFPFRGGAPHLGLKRK